MESLSNNLILNQLLILFNLVSGYLPDWYIPSWWFIVFNLVWALLGFLFAILMAVMVTKILKLKSIDRKLLNEILVNTLNQQQYSYTNKVWQRIKSLANSDNSSDWKLAIIEADTILDQLLTRMGYPGGNLGERLKAVEPSDFLTLEQAWEAHKVRNTIAHQGGLEISKREVDRVISLYEQVFKEFNYI